MEWLEKLPQHVPHISRLGLLRAWSPDSEAVVPTHAKGVKVAQADEALLRSLKDNSLLTFDYPK